MNLSLKLSAARESAAKAETLPRTREAATRYPAAVLAFGAGPRGDHEPTPSALDRDVLVAEGCPASRRATRTALRPDSH